MRGKEIWDSMGVAVKKRDYKHIKELRKMIAHNMEERGMFYDNELGWIRHDRLQDLIKRGYMTFDDKTETYVITEMAIVEKKDIYKLIQYLQGGLLE